MRRHLKICLRANFAGIESSRLYSETYLGTKDLVEDYYNERKFLCSMVALFGLRNTRPHLSPIEPAIPTQFATIVSG